MKEAQTWAKKVELPVFMEEKLIESKGMKDIHISN